MSMERCTRCADPIDTDEDFDCYIQAGKRMEPYCERCQEQPDDPPRHDARPQTPQGPDTAPKEKVKE